MSTQFIFYCDFFNSRFQCFNYELEETTKKFGTFSNERKFLMNLKSMKQLDLMLTELSLLICEYFKKMLLLTIMSDVIVLVIDIYWIYGGLIYGDNPYFLRKFPLVIFIVLYNLDMPIIQESSLCPYGKIVTILILFSSCGNVQAEKSKSPGYIHLLNSDSMTIVHSKRRYLLQKLHTIPYQFHGHQFFYMNYGTLIGVKWFIKLSS